MVLSWQMELEDEQEEPNYMDENEQDGLDEDMTAEL